MSGFEYTHFDVPDQHMEPDAAPETCTCRRRDCYDCADYSG